MQVDPWPTFDPSKQDIPAALEMPPGAEQGLGKQANVDGTNTN